MAIGIDNPAFVDFIDSDDQESKIQVQDRVEFFLKKSWQKFQNEKQNSSRIVFTIIFYTKKPFLQKVFSTSRLSGFEVLNDATLIFDRETKLTFFLHKIFLKFFFSQFKRYFICKTLKSTSAYVVSFNKFL